MPFAAWIMRRSASSPRSSAPAMPRRPPAADVSLDVNAGGLNGRPRFYMPRTLHDTVVESSPEREIERLRVQARIGWPQERDALVASGLRDAVRVIEVGC